MESEKLGTCDAHDGLHRLHSMWTPCMDWREQLQGEATASDPLAKYARCDAVKRKAVQPQGEATRCSCQCHIRGYRTDADCCKCLPSIHAQTEGGEKPPVMPIQTNTQNLAVQSNTETAVEYGNPAYTGSDPEGETERAPLIHKAVAADSPSGTAKSGRELPLHCSKCGKPICNPATMTIASGMVGKIDQFCGYCSCALHFVPSEPSSPPAQPAGGAREWRLRMDLLGVSQHDFWDDMRAQGYADQRVRQQDEIHAADIRAIGKRIDELTPQVAQLRQERDALKAKLEERDAC